MPHTLQAVVFAGPDDISVRTFDLCPCGEEDVVVRTLYSMVSSGTELRTLSETTRDRIPGYASIGEVIETGPKVRGYRVGDLVSLRNCPRLIPGIQQPCGGHASLHVFPTTTEDRPVLLPPAARPLDYIVAEIASISLRGVDAAGPQPGETAVVIGQGLIGALSAAWLHSRGCRVIVTDMEQRRLDRALAWGAAAAVKGGDGDAEERILAQTNRGADIVVEASGSSPGVLLAYRLVGNRPRSAPGSPYYRGEPVSTFRHAWPRLVMQATYGREVSINPHSFHPGEGIVILSPADRSLEDRLRSVEGLRKKDIRAADFIDRIVPFGEAPTAYRALRDDKDANFSLIFDWTTR